MEAQQAPPSGSARDWSELPLDAVATLFATSPSSAPLRSSWARARVPLVAPRRQGALPVAFPRHGKEQQQCRQEAVDRAAGQLEVFVGAEFPDDDLLKYIGSRAPSLKVLGLTSCTDILNEGFVEAINMYPLLEELKLSACGSICGRATYEAVGKACQNLKIFELIKDRHCRFKIFELNKDMPCRLFGPVQDSAENFDDDEAHGIATMHGLRSLKIYCSNITNEALAAILGNCPDLESLDLHRCRNIVMDDAMLAKCAGIKMSLHPNIYQLCHDILL